MSREKEFEKVKKIIKENFEDAHCGIYNTENLVGDFMITLFKGKFFVLDICYGYSYYEVFGTTEQEWLDLKNYYKNLKEEE